MLDYAATLGNQRAGQRSWIVRLLRAILRPVATRDPRVLPTRASAFPFRGALPVFAAAPPGSLAFPRAVAPAAQLAAAGVALFPALFVPALRVPASLFPAGRLATRVAAAPSP